MLSDHWDDDNRASNGVFHQPPLKAMTEVASAQPLAYDGQRLPAPFQDYFALSPDFPAPVRAGASPILRRYSPQSTRVSSDPFAGMFETPSPTQAGSPEPTKSHSLYGSALPRPPSPTARSMSNYGINAQAADVSTTLSGLDKKPSDVSRPARRDGDATLVRTTRKSIAKIKPLTYALSVFKPALRHVH
jgi:hypothetical protein